MKWIKRLSLGTILYVIFAFIPLLFFVDFRFLVSDFANAICISVLVAFQIGVLLMDFDSIAFVNLEDYKRRRLEVTDFHSEPEEVKRADLFTYMTSTFFYLIPLCANVYVLKYYFAERAGLNLFIAIANFIYLVATFVYLIFRVKAQFKLMESTKKEDKLWIEARHEAIKIVKELVFDNSNNLSDLSLNEIYDVIKKRIECSEKIKLLDSEKKSILQKYVITKVNFNITGKITERE